MSKQKIVERIKFLESEVARLEAVVADYESILPDDGDESVSPPKKKSILKDTLGASKNFILKSLPYVAVALIAFFAVKYVASIDWNIGPNVGPKPNIQTDYDKLPDVLK